MQQLANKAVTTLNGAINNSVTSLVVTSAALFPAAGDFTILIDDELIKVTAVSGTSFTIVRGQESTTAASHSSGANVTIVLTKTVVEALLAEAYQIGGYASRPATARAGTIYQASDIELSWRSNGTTWDLIRPCYVPYANRIDFTSWTALNHGAAVFTDYGGVINAKLPDASGTNIRGHYKALPAAPYTLTFAMEVPLPLAGFFCSGIGLSTGAAGAAWMLQVLTLASAPESTISVDRYSSATAFATSAFRQGISYSRPLFLQISDDNTNFIYRVSHDGKNYTQVFSHARNTSITPTHVQLVSNFEFAAGTWGNRNNTYLGYWEV